MRRGERARGGGNREGGKRGERRERGKGTPADWLALELPLKERW